MYTIINNEAEDMNITRQKKCKCILWKKSSRKTTIETSCFKKPVQLLNANQADMSFFAQLLPFLQQFYQCLWSTVNLEKQPLLQFFEIINGKVFGNGIRLFSAGFELELDATLCWWCSSFVRIFQWISRTEYGSNGCIWWWIVQKR